MCLSQLPCTESVINRACNTYLYEGDCLCTALALHTVVVRHVSTKTTRYISFLKDIISLQQNTPRLFVMCASLVESPLPVSTGPVTDPPGIIHPTTH